MLMSLFGTTEPPDNVDVSHWIIYIWTATLSTVVSDFAHIRHVSDPVAEHRQDREVREGLRGRAADQRHVDAAEQMTIISRSPFALALNERELHIVAEGRVGNLLILVSRPVAPQTVPEDSDLILELQGHIPR
jgi:hypothetical protein